VSRVSGRKNGSVATYVALAADHLLAVVLGGESLERGLNDTTTETEDKVKSRLLLDVVVGKGTTILELLSGEDQALLVRGNALLVLDLGLDVVDGVGGLDLKGDGLARKGLDEAAWRLLSVGVLYALRCVGAARGFREAYICTVTQIHVSDIQHATETLCIALTGDGLRVLNTIPTFATGSGQEFENRKVCSVGGRRRLVP
jgi:hypothetical protein